MFYSLGVYRWRLRKINQRDGTVCHLTTPLASGSFPNLPFFFVQLDLMFLLPSTLSFPFRHSSGNHNCLQRFDDPYGPYLLTLVLSIAMVATLAVMWTRNADDASESSSSFSFSSSSTASSSSAASGLAQLIGAPSLAFTELRQASCGTVPGSANLPVVPSEYRLSEAVDAARIASAALRTQWLEVFEQALAHDVRIERLEVTDVTEIPFCIPALFPDCSAHVVLHRLETQQAVLLFHGVTPPATRVPLKGGTRGYVLESACAARQLNYEVVLDNVVKLTEGALSTTAGLNVLVDGFYPAAVPLQPDTEGSKLITRFEYVVRAPREFASVVARVDLAYATDEDRAMARTPQRAAISVILKNEPSLALVRFGEGLLQALAARTASPPDYDDGLSDGGIIGIVVGIFVVILLLMLLVLWIRRQRHRQHKLQQQSQLNKSSQSEKKRHGEPAEEPAAKLTTAVEVANANAPNLHPDAVAEHSSTPVDAALAAGEPCFVLDMPAFVTSSV
jgi:hypothetical protein